MIFDKVYATSSKLEKVAFLKEATTLEKEFFRTTYDEYILSNINKIDSKQMSRLALSEVEYLELKRSNVEFLECCEEEFQAFHESDTYEDYLKRYKELESGKRTFESSLDDFFVLYELLNRRDITGNDARERVTRFLDTVDFEALEWFIKSLKKDLKIGIQISSLNEAFGKDFIKTFEVQLANSYKKDKKYKVSQWLASPKLDGLRCIYVYNRKEEYPNHITRGLYTRNGHKMYGFEHIESVCENICKMHDLNFVDGELYSHEIDFESIQGAVMSDVNIIKEQKEKIYYNLFACEQNSENFTSIKMVELLKTISATYINIVPQVLIENTWDEIIKLHDVFVEQGYEGIMLRDPVHYYDFKRSDKLIKYKNFIESDFEIIGVENGKEGTQFERTIGRIWVKKGEIESWVGSGFTEQKREDFLRLHLSNELIGKMVEIKYQGVTQDNSLRFPVVKKLKLDR